MCGRRDKWRGAVESGEQRSEQGDGNKKKEARVGK